MKLFTIIAIALTFTGQVLANEADRSFSPGKADPAGIYTPGDPQGKAVRTFGPAGPNG